MLQDHPWAVPLRILLAAILIALLNLAPRPHALRQALDAAHRALLADDFASAYRQTARAAEQLPWRSDLTIQAARYSLQSGQPLPAIELLEMPRIAARLTPEELLLLGDAYQQSGDAHMAAAIWRRVAELAPAPEIYQRLADYALAQQDIPAAIAALQELLRYTPGDASLNYRLGLLYATTEPESALAYLAQAADLDPTLAPGAGELQRKIRTATLFEEPAYTLTAAGRVLAILDEWRLAEAAFRKATQLRPDYAEAWAFLGEARQQNAAVGSPAVTGLGELQHALRLDPDSVSANLLMGLYWSRQADASRAAGYIRSALVIEANNPLLYAELGNVLAQSGDLPAAQAAFQQAIALAPEDPQFYRLFAEFSLTHRIQVHEIALPAARTAVILAPQDPQSLDLLAQTMLVLRDFYSAERFLLRALEIDPGYAPAHLHLGIVFIQRDDSQSARHEFELAASLGSGTWTASQAQRFISYYYP